MGIPSFYRWLHDKYKKVIVTAVDESKFEEGRLVLPDASLPNPNKLEFDNLYLDMNGIIHPCSHPEEGPLPKDENEMIERVKLYTLYVFSIVRPRKLIYIALDGVAPRAKMNQQRSRRFLSGKERLESEALAAEMRAKWADRGVKVKGTQDKKTWDSNVITPGTPFMANLSARLKEFVQTQILNDPAWRAVKVIYSDSNVPGEGEHKIMNFIRSLRTTRDYDPNTRHCVHGLDADLFMLSLATHEPHFSLLREHINMNFKAAQKKHCCEYCGSTSHSEKDCRSNKTFENIDTKQVRPAKFTFAHIYVLREYLKREMEIKNFPEWDFERTIDDFIFLCFFVGNDFLPHLPSLRIREGAVDFLMNVYKKEFFRFGGYLTENGRLHKKRISFLLRKLGQIEDAVFKKRIDDKKHAERMRRTKGSLSSSGSESKSQGSASRGQPTRASQLPQTQTRRQAQEERNRLRLALDEEKRNDKRSRSLDATDLSTEDSVNRRQVARKTRSLPNKEPLPNKKVKDSEVAGVGSDPKSKSEEETVGTCLRDTVESALDSALEGLEESEDDEMLRSSEKELADLLKSKREEMCDMSKELDPVLLGVAGWKQRYYLKKFGEKFDAKAPARIFLKLFSEYMRGLEWVFRYYYDSCASWEWFFPFHYAPFASDLAEFGCWEGNFEKGTPLSPFAQLMGVMPPSSGHCLPNELSELMRDPESAIVDFYPSSFRLDANGNRFSWQAVVLLPFIDEKRLLKVIDPIIQGLSEDEKDKNRVGKTLFFELARTSFAQRLAAAVKNSGKQSSFRSNESEALAGKYSALEDESRFIAPLPGVFVAGYEPNPEQTHLPRLLSGVAEAPQELSESDHNNVNRGKRFGRFTPKYHLRHADQSVIDEYDRYEDCFTQDVGQCPPSHPLVQSQPPAGFNSANVFVDQRLNSFGNIDFNSAFNPACFSPAPSPNGWSFNPPFYTQQQQPPMFMFTPNPFVSSTNFSNTRLPQGFLQPTPSRVPNCFENNYDGRSHAFSRNNQRNNRDRFRSHNTFETPQRRSFNHRPGQQQENHQPPRHQGSTQQKPVHQRLANQRTQDEPLRIDRSHSQRTRYGSEHDRRQVYDNNTHRNARSNSTRSRLGDRSRDDLGDNRNRRRDSHDRIFEK